jgi:hypothetical protein
VRFLLAVKHHLPRRTHLLFPFHGCHQSAFDEPLANISHRASAHTGCLGSSFVGPCRPELSFIDLQQYLGMLSLVRRSPPHFQQLLQLGPFIPRQPDYVLDLQIATLANRP